MRYLKLYEDYSDQFKFLNDTTLNKEKLVDDLMGALVELIDRKFNVNVTPGRNSLWIEIKKIGDPNGDQFYNGWDEFELDEIEEDVRQVSDYIKSKYNDILIEYSPETRWENKCFFSLDDINIKDIICFDIYIKYNNVSESFVRPVNGGTNNKDWDSDGFKSNKDGLKEAIENIFIELEDDGHTLDVRLGKMGIAVTIEHKQRDEVNNEVIELVPVNYELSKECSESVFEYIKERNPDLQSKVGIDIKYQIEHYTVVDSEDTVYKDWKRDIVYDDFPSIEWKDKIIQLKIYLTI